MFTYNEGYISIRIHSTTCCTMGVWQQMELCQLPNLQILTYKNLNGLHTTNTRSHLLSLSIPSSTINPYRYSFFINTPFTWNTILFHILQLTNQTALRRFLLISYILNCMNYQVSCNCALCVYMCMYVCIRCMSAYPRVFDKIDNLYAT